MERSETRKIRSIALLALWGAGCVATPLPTPPSVEPARVHLFEDQGYTRMRADEGALDGFATAALRITTSAGSVEVRPSGRGAFTAFVPGPATSTFYFEALFAHEDRFVGSITRGAGTVAIAADPGPDGDADGSPDAIDCAPMDPTLGGRRCPAACIEERCDMRDDDCDGLVDEGCSGAPCTNDTECSLGFSCAMGLCGPIPCDPMTGGCPAGTVCTSGACEARGGDADGDGFSVPADCDDGNDRVHPMATEVCNMIDDDCSGMVDDSCMSGVCMTAMECAFTEECLMGVCVTRACMADSDCPVAARCTAGTCRTAMTDGDMDGYSLPADCDDASTAVHPGAVETCNTIDDDCDGTLDEGCMTTCTADSDCPATFECQMTLCRRITCTSSADCPAMTSCVFGECRTDGGDGDMDGVSVPLDCNDADPDVLPGAPELCNMRDDDCDGLVDESCT
jgi:hypothetical protein